MYKKTSINKKIINDGKLAKKNVTFCEKNKDDICKERYYYLDILCYCITET